MTIGHQIREARLNSRMTVSELAKYAKTSPQTVRNWERSINYPRPPKWKLIEKALGIHLEHTQNKATQESLTLAEKISRLSKRQREALTEIVHAML